MIIAPKPIERYLEVKKWDKGYLVVEAKCSIGPHAIEEYIDLVPTLEELAIDPDTFCSQVEHVEVARV